MQDARQASIGRSSDRDRVVGQKATASLKHLARKRIDRHRRTPIPTSACVTKLKSVSARELAGLSETELAALEVEFMRSPFRQRTDALRFAIPTGALLCAVGALALLLHVNAFALPSDPPVSVIEASGASSLLGGLV